MKRYIRSGAYANYKISDANKFSKFIGDVEKFFLDKVSGADGTYDIQGTQFVTDGGYEYEIIVRHLTDIPKEVGYIKIDYTKSPGGGVYAWREDDEETTFATGKTLDDILDEVVGECAILVEDYENFQ